MKVIESETVVIHKPAQEIYSFLSNLNHFRDLMPPQVVNWQSTDDTCSFTIQGMTDLSLRLDLHPGQEEGHPAMGHAAVPEQGLPPG